MSDSAGGCSVNWNAPVSVWKSPHVWLFAYSGTRIYTYIPLGVLSEETQRFIEEKVIEYGGAVA